MSIQNDKKMKKRVFLGFVLFLVVFISGCTTNSTIKDTGKIKIATSFYPLTYFAEQVGGDLVEVTQVSSKSGNAHNFEPQPRDVVSIEGADAFFYNGFSFDVWAEKLATENRKISVPVLERVNETHPEYILDARGDLLDNSINGSEAKDPHAWLDPVAAHEYVDVIEARLSEIAPENHITFKENAQSIQRALASIDLFNQKKLSSCLKRTLFVSHNFLGYFAKRYGFNVVSISGLSPDDEPSAKEFGELVSTMRDKGVAYIFVEELANKELTEALARETGASVLTINPLEGLTEKEIQEGEEYISLMEKNVEKISIGLECTGEGLVSF